MALARLLVVPLRRFHIMSFFFLPKATRFRGAVDDKARLGSDPPLALEGDQANEAMLFFTSRS